MQLTTHRAGKHPQGSLGKPSAFGTRPKYHPDRQQWRYGMKQKPKGFQAIPRRWVVERAFAWLGQARRLAKDYERLPTAGEAMIYAAMSRLMIRRLTRDGP